MMTPSRRFNENWLPTFFDDFFDNEWMVRSKAAAPAMNVMENENDYKVEIAAPGMKKEDVNIHLDQDHNLVVSMETRTRRTIRNIAVTCVASSHTPSSSKRWYCPIMWTRKRSMQLSTTAC